MLTLEEAQRISLAAREAAAARNWTMVIAVTFWVLGRKPRPTGFWVVLWCGMYAPVRFCLDFFRNADLPQESCDRRTLLHNTLQDVRLGGLTPAQMGCLVMAGLGIWAFVWMRRAGGNRRGVAET